MEIKDTGDYKEKIEGNFIRVLNPQRTDLNDYFKKRGALSVEYELPESIRGSNDLGYEYHNFQLDEVIKKYEEAHELTDHEKEIGRQIREGTYDEI